MRRKYQKSELNIEEHKEQIQKELLMYHNTMFVDCKIKKSDQTTIKIDYNVDNLNKFKDFKKADQVVKLRLGISLLRLIEKRDDHFQTILNDNNIYISYDLEAKILKRVLRHENETDEQLLNQVKALVGSLFLKYPYDEIIISDNVLLKKDNYLKDIYLAEDKEQLEKKLMEMIKFKQEDLYHNYALVKKKKVSKNKKLKNTYLITSITFLIVLLFLSAYYIPNRNSQLDAYEKYEQKIYEDVLVELENTQLRSMSSLTKYIMSEATIRLAPLSDTQKENILFNLSPEVDENILDFWVLIGQNKLEDAYSKSIENNDAQQKAYVLILLIDQAQNDASLDEDEKQELISTYQAELDKINAQLEEGTTDE